MHKNASKAPGRPVISGNKFLASRIGEYVDFFLQPLVVNTKSYIKDIKQVINNLETLHLPTGAYLVTSLYNDISHNNGLQAVEFYLQSGDDIPHTQKQFILYLIDFDMSHNYFWFDSQFYLQVKGVLNFEPGLANLFMARWDDDTIYGRHWPALLIYKRYIDDVLFVWNGLLGVSTG